MNQPRIDLRRISLFERPVALRLPFRFGAVTLTHAPQLFVRAEIEVDGNAVTGQAAELLAPKWFDKNPELTNEDNFQQLRDSVRIAALLYCNCQEALPAFKLHSTMQPAHYRRCAERDLNGLIASFGATLVDRAILDGLCRLSGISVFDAVRQNLPGISAHMTPDLYSQDMDTFLEKRPDPHAIAVRHTVGMADAIFESDLQSRVDDGLPESLEAVISTYGHRYFKLKLGGNVAFDIDRLSKIAAVLDRIEGNYHVSLDGNEQYDNAVAVVELIDAIEANPALQRLWESTLYIEQPITRQRALSRPVHAIAERKPVAIDESDSDIGVFPVARALGYAGISSKSCKGFYRALLNAARVARWNCQAGDERHFMIAEDLTTQGGIAVQQDFALAVLIGATHVERNGHHYVDGFAGAPKEEQQRFSAAHPDLYVQHGGKTRLKISQGMAQLASLKTPGLAVGCEPDWTVMTFIESFEA